MKNNEYTPDKWLVVKIYGENVPLTYKIFASWYGGYTGSDSWQMNSGIQSVEEVDNFLHFKSFSGSVYCCHKDAYGIHMYGYNILEKFIREAREKNVTIEKLPQGENWLAINYI